MSLRVTLDISQKKVRFLIDLTLNHISVNTTVSTIIDACMWLPSHFLVFSENVYSPFLYYTYFGCAIPALAIGIYVFINQRNNRTSRLLLLMMLSLALWVFGSLVFWATEYPSYVMFFWTVVNITEPFVYFFALYFTYSFIYQDDFSSLQKLLFSFPLLPTIVLAPTSYMLIGFNLSNCDRNAVEGILSLYGYTIEILYVALIVFFVLYALLKKGCVSEKDRKPVIIFAIGVVAFLTTFSLGNLIELFTQNSYIGQYGLLGAPVFAGLLAYLIVKFEVFNIKLFSIYAFMAALWLLVFSLLFIRTSDNAQILIAVTLVLLFIAGKSLGKSIASEITGRRENEKLAIDLAAANKQLRELDRTKSEFVSIASHQLRTPLTAIRGFAELMSDGSYGAVPPTFAEPLAHIDESVQNMAMSINDFLNVSRIESGTMQYEYTTFSLRAVTETIVLDLRQFASKRGLLLSFKDETSSDHLVKADEGKVRQILQNLIDNSIKYTPSGSVTVSVSENVAKGIALVSIVDTGIGMSDETLGKIFDKFVRATNANTANIYGTGLGLYIAREMANQMHGKVSATSWGEGKGSTFLIELPIAPKSEPLLI